MAIPYFNSHSLNSDTKKAYEPAISNSGSVLHDCPQYGGVAFGLEVQQTAPRNYLNISNPCDERLHNPFSDYRLPKVLVRVLYHPEAEQSMPLGFSNTTKAQQRDENILYTSQSGLRIDRVWSMAAKANSQSHSINANHSPSDPTLKDTAGNSSSADNASQKAYLASEKRKAYRQSDAGRAACKAYELSENRKASRKAYEQSDAGKAARKAYRKSDKGIASSRAYERSEKRQASRKAYRESDGGKAYQNTYHKVFKKTGDRELAKIAAKQASAFIRESNKARKSDLESISSSPITPLPLRLTGKKIVYGEREHSGEMPLILCLQAP